MKNENTEKIALKVKLLSISQSKIEITNWGLVNWS